MFIFLSVVVITIFCVVVIGMFKKDKDDDLIFEVQAGKASKFKFSIKKHDKE